MSDSVETMSLTDAPEVAGVHNVLTLCGVSSAVARQTFIKVEGLDTIDSFATLNGDNDVTEMAKRMASRSSVATGRVILGTMQIKKIQALVFWVKDHHKRNLIVNPDEWTTEEMTNTMQRKEAEHNFANIDVDLIDPGKCQTDIGWDAWQIAFLNKLNATMGAAKVPVAYIVRDNVDNNYIFEDEEEKRMHQMPLLGENYKRDNKLVYNMLKASCVKTDAWTWIQDHDKSSNGRKAWQTLVGHYDGVGELNKRVERAKEEISRLHYKDEKVFPFERFITKLKENFFVLAKDRDEGLTEKQKVDTLMKGIKSSDPSIVAAKTDVYKDYRSNFNAAISFLSGLVANLHSGAQLEYSNRHLGKRRYVSAIDSSDGRGSRGRARRGSGRYGQQRGNGRGGGRGMTRVGYGTGRGDRRIRINNVDVTDPNRNFTSSEWDQLGPAKAYVVQLRNNSCGRGGRDGSRGANGARSMDRQRSASSATITTTAPSNDGSAQANEPSILSEMTERGSQNGRSFGRGAYA